MEYRNLGKCGLKVSELCLGTMQFGWTADEETSYQILDEAVASGINFIDTADVYSRWVEGNPGGVAESMIGRWLKRRSIARQDLVITTKVRGKMGEGPNHEGLSRAHIMDAIEGSLRRLGTEYIDLYQAHWFDQLSPIDETLRAFDDLIRQGKVRYIGCSNYPAWRLVESLWVSRSNGLAEFISLQPHYNLVHRDEFERELAGACRVYGVGVIPYSPLAAGFLTGKYRRETITESARMNSAKRYFDDQNWRLLEIMEDMGKRRGGASLSQIALAWLLSDSLITSPIIGPRSLEQLKDNLGAVGLRLDVEEKGELDEASDWPGRPK